MKDYQVGTAQKMVLDALGMTADGFSDAERQFGRLGIVVGSRREGRSSVPVVTVLDRCGGCVNNDGDGESWQEYADIDLAPIARWVRD